MPEPSPRTTDPGAVPRASGRRRLRLPDRPRRPRPVGWASRGGFRRRGLFLAAALLLAAPAAALGPDGGSGPALGAQEPEGEATGEEAPAGTALRIFIDCQTRFCDLDFFRREIAFVNYVRDRRDAQVHLILTSERTGGGGRNFVLDFIGREAFTGVEEHLETSTRANLAEEEILEAVTRAIKMGLVRYVARTPAAERLRISWEEREGGVPEVATPEEDPWNFWVFRTSLNGSLSGEERRDALSLFGSFSANRVTEALKIELDLGGHYSESNFDVDSTTTITSITRFYNAAALVVWSLGDHWSAGFQSSAGHSSFGNRELAVRVAPAVEYNLFRYQESERKQLTFRYAVGLNHFDWEETTIFGRDSETRLDQRLSVSLNVRQPWGSAGGRLRGSTFLDDLGRHRLDLFGGVDLRLFKGLSLDLNGSVARVQDQINLPAGDATEEEILLRIRELATGFEYRISVGFSYTFGSIFSNVVNPRF